MSKGFHLKAPEDVCGGAGANVCAESERGNEERWREIVSVEVEGGEAEKGNRGEQSRVVEMAFTTTFVVYVSP